MTLFSHFPVYHEFDLIDSTINLVKHERFLREVNTSQCAHSLPPIRGQLAPLLRSPCSSGRCGCQEPRSAVGFVRPSVCIVARQVFTWLLASAASPCPAPHLYSPFVCSLPYLRCNIRILSTNSRCRCVGGWGRCHALAAGRQGPEIMNYDVGNREPLALVLAHQEWRHLLEGSAQPFVVWTVHKNLAYLRSAK